MKAGKLLDGLFEDLSIPHFTAPLGQVLQRIKMARPTGHAGSWPAVFGSAKTPFNGFWRKPMCGPHQLERYMASDDPDFETKAADVIGLYLALPQHAAEFTSNVGNAFLTQTLTTTPGANYTFSFYLEVIALSGNGEPLFEADWNGATELDLTSSSTIPAGFQLYSYNVMATSASSVIEFGGVSGWLRLPIDLRRAKPRLKCIKGRFYPASYLSFRDAHQRCDATTINVW